MLRPRKIMCLMLRHSAITFESNIVMYWPDTDTDTRIGAALVSGKDSQNFSPEDDFQYVRICYSFAHF